MARQPPKFTVLRVNQVKARGAEDATEEVVLEEAATKNVAESRKIQPPLIHIMDQEPQGRSG